MQDDAKTFPPRRFGEIEMKRSNKKPYRIIITFQENDKGETYELERIKLVTKPMTEAQARKLGEKEADKCWDSYWMTVSPC